MDYLPIYLPVIIAAALCFADWKLGRRGEGGAAYACIFLTAPVLPVAVYVLFRCAEQGLLGFWPTLGLSLACLALIAYVCLRLAATRVPPEPDPLAWALRLSSWAKLYNWMTGLTLLAALFAVVLPAMAVAAAVGVFWVVLGLLLLIAFWPAALALAIIGAGVWLVVILAYLPLLVLALALLTAAGVLLILCPCVLGIRAVRLASGELGLSRRDFWGYCVFLCLPYANAFPLSRLRGRVKARREERETQRIDDLRREAESFSQPTDQDLP